MAGSVPRGRPVEAVVLAAGLGTRMRRPDVPKALVDVGGRPMLARVLSGLARSGYRRCVVVVGHLGDMVRHTIGTRHGPMAVEYAVQPTPDGTADAAARALPLLATGEALLTWTDILAPPAHYELLATSWRLRRVVALTTVLRGNPSAGALVEFDPDLRMTAFTEKPAGVARGWADGGIGVFDLSMFERMGRVGRSSRGEKEIASALQSALAEGAPIGVEKLAGPWVDLGTPEAVARCVRELPELLTATGAGDRP